MTSEAVLLTIALHPVHVLLVGVVAFHLVRDLRGQLARRRPSAALRPVEAPAAQPTG